MRSTVDGRNPTSLGVEQTIDWSEPNKEHLCGCVTFWHHYTKRAPVLLYRRVCATHKWYAHRLGIVVG
jgi:hypothetical protein